MNRIMNKQYDVAGKNNIWQRVKAGLVPGGRISDTGLVVDSDTGRAGTTVPSKEPEKWQTTDYDLTRWERSRWGLKDVNPRFNTAPSGREPIRDMGQDSHLLPTLLEDSPSMKLEHGSITKGKFSTALAERNPLRIDGYVKTGGLKLGPQFDWGDSTAAVSSGVGGHWLKRAVKINSGLKDQRPTPPRSDTADLDIIDVDCAQKMTMATYARYSPIKYTAAFSATARGFKPNPTTAPWVGPGAYPKVDQDFIPGGGKFNKRERGIGNPILKTDPREVGSGFKTFSEVNTAGVEFPRAGNPGKSRTRLRLERVYPKLAQKIYQPKQKTDFRSQAPDIS